jgi:sugar phosphate isomerase/epimerase
MVNRHPLSRRRFVTISAASAANLLAQKKREHVPVGLLIYAVLADWKKDFNGTLTAVSQMGYEGLELTQYESWTSERTKEVRKLLDDLHLKVFATHTEPEFFVPGDKMKAMLELNHILGTETISCVRGLANSATPAANNPPNSGGGRRGGGRRGDAQPAPKGGGGGQEIGYHPVKAANEADAWKELADVLQAACEVIKREKMVVSFHNHAVEFQTRGNGVGRPIDILARGAKDLTYTTDVNVATRAGSDVVAFIKQYPRRTNSLLLTDGPPDDNGHAPALGKGTIPWNDVFDAAETVGGVKFYLLTHGATELTPLETVKRDLEQYKVIHA